jgi:hypothetical protein
MEGAAGHDTVTLAAGFMDQLHYPWNIGFIDADDQRGVAFPQEATR